MASLVLKMSVSLDGYVAPPDGSSDWVAAGRSDDGARWTLETVSNAGAHLMGATTYTGWAGYWPSGPGPFAKPMNEIPKVVFSNSLTSADRDETTIVAGDLAHHRADQHHRVQRRSRRPRLRGAPLIALSTARTWRVPPDARLGRWRSPAFTPSSIRATRRPTAPGWPTCWAWTWVDAGGGWLIFALPPAELAAHPASGEGGDVELYLMCDGIESTVQELRDRGVAFDGPVTDQGWGRVTKVVLPSGARLGLYEPRHPSPPPGVTPRSSRRSPSS